jgi:hypothetical protein
MKKYVDGVLVDCSVEETTQIENEQKTNKQIHIQEREDAEKKEQTDAELKASAKKKLIAGEPLTEEEADTIVL